MIYCNICGGQTTKIAVKEQMLRLQDLFYYNKCEHCGHAHLDSLPVNMDKYYDTKEYYSFKNNTGLIGIAIRNSMAILKKILIGISIKKSYLFSSALESLLSTRGINAKSNILDYGCGAGQFVKELIALGYRNARGFDPYLPNTTGDYQHELFLTNDLKTLKTACWDIITLNHVFEHLENPVEMLHTLNSLLCSNGKLVLRFPIIDSFAFEKYRENWVQFDAPRHLNLFTRKSIRLAVEKSGGFKIVAMYDDSFHFQFTGSELYLKNRSLNPQDNNRLKRMLSFKTYQYHFLAKKLNKQNKGDQMVIILERS